MANGILGQIELAKRAEIEARFDGVSLDSLRSRARPARHSFAGALRRPGSRFILEIKKASPSAGAIRPGADAAALASGYAGVADALSVLIDQRFFGGSLDDLASARRNFAGPILAKDFFLDPRQVVEARIAGADCVLVMLSLVEDSVARGLIAEARRFGMDALVEVHDEAEMRRANALGARVIGVNNRDLRDLSVDLATTERLASLARGDVLISESGISSAREIGRLSRHADGFLIGSSLMRSENPAIAARKLIFGRVKMCGLNRREDVEAARPAAFAGFVFVSSSTRHVTAVEAAPLAGLARNAGMLPVGVFQDAPLPVVVDVATLLNLHAVQLHGSEESDYVGRLKRELTCEIWTAVMPGLAARRHGDRSVFDSGPGGTGRTFDWQLVRGDERLQSGLLAGGIGPANARSAAAMGAYAIDVGSATDERPGLKSPRKIRALFEALRPDCRLEHRQCA